MARRKNLLFPTIILIALSLLCGCSGKKGEGKGGKQDAGVHAVPVLSEAAKKEDLPIYLSGIGSVKPLNTVTVHTRVDGQIDTVSFVEGQLVKKGDLLVQIDPRPFQVMLMQADGQMAKDEATLKNAKLDLERYKQAAGAVSQQQLATQLALVVSTEAGLKIDDAQIESAKLQLVYSRVEAPIDGKIGLRLVDQGNIVHAADATGIAVITQLQPISIVFTLPQDDIPQLVAAMRTSSTLKVVAFDRDLKTKLSDGILAAVDNQIDLTSGTVRLKANFENTDGSLFPNQFVNARLLVDTKKDAVTVPSAAIQHGPDSTFVYVIKNDGTTEDKTVEMRTITTGPSEGDRVSIVQGVDIGDVVVTDGVDKLQQGAKVTSRTDAAAPAPSSTVSPAASPSQAAPS